MYFPFLVKLVVFYGGCYYIDFILFFFIFFYNAACWLLLVIAVRALMGIWVLRMVTLSHHYKICICHCICICWLGVFKFIDSSDAVEIYERSVNFLIWMLFHKDRKEWRCQWCDSLLCVSLYPSYFPPFHTPCIFMLFLFHFDQHWHWTSSYLFKLMIIKFINSSYDV